MTDKPVVIEKAGTVARNLGGRPFSLSDPEELSKGLQEYFSEIPKLDWTVTGLALHLGIDRDTLLNYEKAAKAGNTNINPVVLRLVKRARAMVENSYEQGLMSGKPVGSIFALKNFGWKDRQEIDQTIKGNISLSAILDATDKLPEGHTTNTGLSD